MIQSQINGIFPTPIYKSKLDRKFTKQELRFVEKIKTKSVLNLGNKRSTNTYILNNPSFTTLKKEIDLFIKDYFSKILLPSKSLFPYITQSWLNYTKINEYHHPHYHVNSYLSGIIYINADKAYDKIIFEHNRYDQIRLSTAQWNKFNSGSWFFPVESGEVIIFPSSLTHSVGKKKGKNIRISLSFNVFVKGDLGVEEETTQLKLS